MRSNGIHSTEFWLSVLALLGIFALIGLGKINAQEGIGILAAALAAAGYSISRGMAKTETRADPAETPAAETRAAPPAEKVRFRSDAGLATSEILLLIIAVCVTLALLFGWDILRIAIAD
jgi:hypothetical protein